MLSLLEGLVATKKLVCYPPSTLSISVLFWLHTAGSFSVFMVRFVSPSEYVRVVAVHPLAWRAVGIVIVPMAVA